MVKRVVVVGGGTGGTILANMLGSKLRSSVKEGKIELLLIGDGFRHYFQPANLDIAFRGVPPDINSRSEPELLSPSVTFVPDPAARIDLQNRAVTTDGGTTYGYDMVVLATGACPSPDLMPGLRAGSVNFHVGPRSSESVWEKVRRFKQGKVVVAIAGVPYKCPPSPDEALFLLDDYFKRKGVRDDVELSLLTPYAKPYPEERVAQLVGALMDGRHMKVMPRFDMESVDPAKKRVYSLEGDEVPYDLLIAVPPHTGSRVIRDSGIGDDGAWIPTDRETLRVKGQDDAYAVGDATDIPISKTGVVAHLEAKAVAETLLAELGGARTEARYNGRINCPMELGGHRAIFVSGTYKTPPKQQAPSLLKYAMKRGFAMLYWSTLSGNLEWLMDAYFGRTSERFERPIIAQN